MSQLMSVNIHRNKDTSLYRTLHRVPKVSTIEGFNCIIASGCARDVHPLPSSPPPPLPYLQYSPPCLPRAGAHPGGYLGPRLLCGGRQCLLHHRGVAVLRLQQPSGSLHLHHALLTEQRGTQPVSMPTTVSLSPCQQLSACLHANNCSVVSAKSSLYSHP